MPRKLFWNRRQSAADNKGEDVPLRQAFHPKWKVNGHAEGDTRGMVNYYQTSMNIQWLVLEWLLETLLNKGVLSVADFANFPILDKLKGEAIVAKTPAEIRDGA